jgi:hypothetical protein
LFFNSILNTHTPTGNAGNDATGSGPAVICGLSRWNPGVPPPSPAASPGRTLAAWAVKGTEFCHSGG